MMESCLICNDPIANINSSGDGLYYINCKRCGFYKISPILMHQIGKEIELRGFYHLLPSSIIPFLSTWIRERNNPYNPIEIKYDVLEKAASIEKLSFSERADRLLIRISEQLNDLSSTFEIILPAITDKGNIDFKNSPGIENIFDLLGIAQIANYHDLIYIINNFLFEENHFLLTNINKPSGNINAIQISPLGWEHLSQIEKKRPFDLCFVAMSFKDEFKPLYFDVLEPAIKDSGWKPFCLIDRIHNENITNEIISNIRKAKFVVADFTENTLGVYYEAGFAKGLGAEVIHMVRKDYLTGDEGNKIHFDTMQINHLVWDNDEPKEDIRKRLFAWITATIGYGPHYQES